ncbi:cysteine desulfurase [bacterium]|nr:cysteine desulfurase [candidate division CSSED10-310 bacterium]
MKPIYLDYNATTPVHPIVAKAMHPYITDMYGNPSSTHWYGFDAREAVDKARAQLARLLECEPQEIIFTGCATESNNIAILGLLTPWMDCKRHLITSAVEHPAVLEVARFCRSLGCSVTVIPVDSNGLVDPCDIEKAITKNTVLISIMHGNNEVGTIQPVEAIAMIAKNHGVLFHCDAAQSIGKIPVNLRKLDVDMLTVAGHKFYAPKGVGALFLKAGTSIQKVYHGASHEFGLRPGTENVTGIVGLGAAAELASENIETRSLKLAETRDRLHNAILAALDDVRLNGHPEKRLPNTLSLGFKNVSATDVMNNLLEVAVSAGAACHGPGEHRISHVLEAMAVPQEYARGTLRLSTGIMTTNDDIDVAAMSIVEAVKRARD